LVSFQPNSSTSDVKVWHSLLRVWLKVWQSYSIVLKIEEEEKEEEEKEEEEKEEEEKATYNNRRRKFITTKPKAAENFKKKQQKGQKKWQIPTKKTN
jgi:hypothetical protein